MRAPEARVPYEIAHAPAGVVTAFLALSPVTALVVSIVAQGAAVAPSMWLAAALIVSSLVSLAKRTPRSA